MAKFRYKKTNEIREAYKIEKKVHIQFTENGKEYVYDEKNIEILKDEQESVKPDNIENILNKIRVYSIGKRCHSCNKITEILTYIKYDDLTNEDLVYPWDKKRLEDNMSHEGRVNHLLYPEIEFYPIKVIGTDSILDSIMLKMFPERIRIEYSKSQKKRYPMNLCQHCGAKQGEFFVYELINKAINEMKPVKVCYEISSSTR